MIFKGWRKKETFAPVHLLPGDTLELNHKDEKGVERVLLREEVGRVMTITEARAFNAEVEGRQAIGGVFIEKE